MKNKNYFFITLFMLSLMSTSWSQIPSADVAIPDQEPLTEVEQYQSEAHQRLNEFEKVMDVFYIKLSKQKQKAQVKNKQKLLNLEKKSAQLRVRIENYKSGDDKAWSVFKLTTSRAIDDFGVEIDALEIED